MALAPVIFVAMLLALLLQLVQKPAIVGDHSLRATWYIDPTISYLARFGKVAKQSINYTKRFYRKYPSDLWLDIVWAFANGVRLSRTLAHAILVATLKHF